MGRKKNFEREEVLDKALSLFWKKGFADTSVQDLEKVTGVNKSGLYSEFEDKEDLYACALKQYLGKASMEEMFTKQPLGWDNVEGFLRMPITCARGKGCFATNSIRELKILPAPARHALTNHLDRVRELVAMNLRGHTKAKPELVADLILSFHNGVALEQNVRAADDLEERIELFISSIRKM